MAKGLDNLYGPIERLSYQQIDKLVVSYQKHKEETPGKKLIREELVRAFHPYFMKYVDLLKNRTGINNSGKTFGFSFKTKDTISFWALFGSRNWDWVKKSIFHVCEPMEDQEIYNELVCIFLVLLDKFTFYSKTSFAQYISQFMRWRIKKWLLTLWKQTSLTNQDLNQELLYIDNLDSILTLDSPCIQEQQETSGQEFKNNMLLPCMDLEWVSNCPTGIFAELSIHERFLLYLHFKENLNVREIQERLGKKKSIWALRLKEILEKLRLQTQ